MATTIVTPPAVEPLTLDETKDHLRVEHTDDDALISELIPAVRRFAEGYCRRALITQTWDLVLDKFPRLIELPFAPLQSVTSINYVDSAGASQLLDAALYQVDTVSEPGRIAPAFGEVWPQTYAELNVVTVRIVAGYGDSPAAVPAGIGRGMLMLTGHLYERRESSIAGAVVTAVPMATEYLLDPYRVLRSIG